MTNPNTPTPSNSVVTEAMRQAGYDALMRCKPILSTDCEKEAVEAIYLAMQSTSTTGSDELVSRVAKAIGRTPQDGESSAYTLRMRLSYDEQLRAAINAINAMQGATPDSERMEICDACTGAGDDGHGHICGKCDGAGGYPATDTDRVAVLRSALERLDRNFDLMLAGKPVRDVAETKAEVRAALSQPLGSQGGEK